MLDLLRELAAKGLIPTRDPSLLVLLGGGVGVTIVMGVVVLIYGPLSVWVERKVSGFMQNRVGPMEVGPHEGIDLPLPFGLARHIPPVVGALAWIVGIPFALLIRLLTLNRVRLPWKMPPGWYGILQSAADGIKLLAKEDTMPDGADASLFKLAPYVVFTCSFTAFCTIPFASGLAPVALEVGLLVYLAMSSLTGIGIVMAGYSSNNKWSLYGAYRSLAQTVSYEVPLVTALLVGVLVGGSMDLDVLSNAQRGGLWNWTALRDAFTFTAAVIYFIAALAEVNRTPFDIPEAESELVCGYHTEYSGMRFSIFFLAEYANMLLVSLIAAVVFFGGYEWGLPVPTPVFLQPLVLLAKGLLGVFVMIWLRWTLPRLRVDQLMNLCWKGLIPIAVVALFGAALSVKFAAVRFAGLGLLAVLVYLYVQAVFVPAPHPRRPRAEGAKP